MSQDSCVVSNDTGANVRTKINSGLAALISNSSGVTAPATTYAYMWWCDTANGLLKQRNAANTAWIIRASLTETPVVPRAANTILAAADKDETIVATGTWTQTLTAAATLGAGWSCFYKNAGSGTVTIDPNASETIDGATTLALSAGQSCIIVCDGTAFYTIGVLGVDQASSDVRYSSSMFPISASVASNALTVGLNPCKIDIRNATLATGTPSNLSIAAALSLVVPSGATLGSVNGQLSRIMLLAINNAGTVELAVVNEAGGVNLDETGLISTTAISAAATSASTIYSTSARTNVPYRVVGYIESTQTTAGTWAAAPSLAQGIGGQAGAAMQSIGFGQTWQNMNASRVGGTTYYNTTGRPIEIALSLTNATSASILYLNGVALQTTPSAGQAMLLGGVIPPGASYSITYGSAASATYWAELR